jgi:hypothetical protein
MKRVLIFLNALLVACAGEDVPEKPVNDSISVIFDEASTQLAIVDTDNDTVAIGQFYNTFKSPPHEIKVEPMGNQKYIILVVTNIVQLGNSEDGLHVFGFNQPLKKVTPLCSFDSLGVYSSDSGIDTLQGIKLYDYAVIKQEDTQEASIRITEYTPFKYVDQRRNKQKIKTTTRVCRFKITGW